MSDVVTSYWPDDIAAKVLSPLAVLKIQAGTLSGKTHGILDAEVVSAVSPARTSHELQLVAPALGGERRTILTAGHATKEPYPVTVEADVFKPTPDPDSEPDPYERDWRPVASTVQEFADLVKKVLQSNQVRSAIQSLIARSNEANSAGDGSGTAA